MTKNIFASIVGRPNVGKSSLLNSLVGEKVAIVTSKPQTTRTRITGILTKDEVQYVFLDTPGMHMPKTKLGGRMAKTVKDSLTDSDLILMLFEPEGEINKSEINLINDISGNNIPAIAAINKTDIIKNKEVLLKRIEEINSFNTFKNIIPISAATGEGLNSILEIISQYSVEGPHFFSPDDYTDIPEKQLVAEIVREKILLYMQEEVPHGTAVEVEKFHEREDKPLIEIDVTIYCEKKSHKGMIIGKGGQMLKKIASTARLDCEEMLGCKINMQCWVKVKKDWRDDENFLNNVGFK